MLAYLKKISDSVLRDRVEVCQIQGASWLSFLSDTGIIYVTYNKRCNASLHGPPALVVKRGRIIVFPVVKTPIRRGLFADILVTPCCGERLRTIV